MQDTSDITAAGYEFESTWLYTVETGYSILIQWKDTSQMYNNGVTDGGAKVRTSTPGKLNVKTGHLEFTLYLGIQYSFGFQ